MVPRPGNATRRSDGAASSTRRATRPNTYQKANQSTNFYSKRSRIFFATLFVGLIALFVGLIARIQHPGVGVGGEFDVASAEGPARSKV